MKNKLNMIKHRVFKLKRNVKYEILNYRLIIQDIRHPKVVILGHQKSGTSAIAGLLASMTEASLTNDIHRSHSNLDVFRKSHFFGTLPSEFYVKYAYELSKNIVKEPEISHFYDSLKEKYPLCKFVYVSRKPEATIKSILSRLGAKNNSSEIYEPHFMEQLGSHPMWKDVLGYSAGRNIIEHLARRIEKLDCMYYSNRTDIVLIKYESFNREKDLKISELSDKLGMIKLQNIDKLKDNQFQPKALEIDIDEYFNSDELKIINEICETSKIIYR